MSVQIGAGSYATVHADANVAYKKFKSKPPPDVDKVIERELAVLHAIGTGKDVPSTITQLLKVWDTRKDGARYVVFALTLGPLRNLQEFLLLSPSAAMLISQQLVDALAYLHTQKRAPLILIFVESPIPSGS